MSTQPACTIRLPAKYIEDASDFIPSLTQTVPPSSAAVQGSSMPMLMLMPTNSDVGLSPLPDHPVATTKRPHAWPITINGDTNMDGQDLAPKLKKLKPTQAQAVVPVSQNKLSIIEIDDNDDLKSEWLNKSSSTANIKEFFIPLPREPGQEKGRMRCKPCEYVVLSLSLLFIYFWWFCFVDKAKGAPSRMLRSWLYQTSLFMQTHWTALSFSFFFLPLIEAVYFSRYGSRCTIQSWWWLVYDTILQDCSCTISISEPLLQLVSVLGELQSPST